MAAQSNRGQTLTVAEIGPMLVPFVDALVATAGVLILSFGLFVTYGLFRVVNMAHGEMVMLGAYVASVAQEAGAGFAAAVILSSLSLAVVAFSMDFVCIGRLHRRSPVATLLATWGFGLLITQCVRLVAGSGGRYVTAPTDGVIQAFGTMLPVYHLALLGGAATMFAASFYFLAWTSPGLRTRAVAEDMQLAEAHGINSRHMFTGAFVLGGALAGLAGAVLAPLQSINPSVGTQFSVSSFLAIISGGLGSIMGPLFGALLVGGAKSLLNHWTNITVSTFALFAIVAALLVMRRRNLELI